MDPSSFKAKASHIWTRAKRDGYELVEGFSDAEVIELFAQKLAAEARLKMLIVTNKEKQARAFQRRSHHVWKIRTVQRSNGREQVDLDAHPAVDHDDEVPF